MTREKFNTEYILCAAIKLADDNPRLLQTTYSDLAICEIGYRHCDIYERFAGLVSRKPSDQGFFTSKGRFVSRREAMRIAYEARQLKAGSDSNPYNELIQDWNQLYSEDLY